MEVYIYRVSLVAQTVKNLPVMQEIWVWSLGQEDPLEKKMATPLQYSYLENSTDREAYQLNYNTKLSYRLELLYSESCLDGESYQLSLIYIHKKGK